MGVMLVYLGLVVIIGITFVVGILLGLQKRLVSPPDGWQDVLKTNITYPKAIYLNVKQRRSGYRRRLILASSQPSFYTNYVNNKVKISDEDKENEGKEFLQRMTRRDVDDPERKLLVGFFHPYANNGGGGEKVLWEAVDSTLGSNKKTIAVIYTTNLDATPLDILGKVQDKFEISTIDQKRVVFIYLRKYKNLIDDSYWKNFTLIGQLFGSFMLSYEAISELSPDIWVDTMGLPGANALVNHLLKIPIINYVHYPIIQPEMFNKLKFKALNISELKKFVPKLGDVFQIGKLVYWTSLIHLYSFLGFLVDIVLVNGSWTYNYITKIWAYNPTSNISILYPPCGSENLLQDFPSIKERENKLLYIAQFRPEKRHQLLVEEYAKFVNYFKSEKGKISDMPTLVLLGSCRTKDDTNTLTNLQALVETLEISDFVEFVVGCSYGEVLSWLSKAKFGLNAMWNEHFGIGVVEYMKNGVIPICHASAGPLLDIVRPESPAKEPNDWKNELGFFFKCEEDPDFETDLQKDTPEGFLRFNSSSASDTESTTLFPSLEKLFRILFVDSPMLIDDNVLFESQAKAFSITNKKFSNTTFSSHWQSTLERAIELEKSYRKTKRSPVTMVY